MSDLVAPTVPTAEEFYNALMRDIEPDLVINQIPLLDKKYAGETEEDKKARMARYTEAYAKYDIAAEKYAAELKVKASAYKKAAFKEAEEKELQQEQAALAQLESQFSS